VRTGDREKRRGEGAKETGAKRGSAMRGIGGGGAHRLARRCRAPRVPGMLPLGELFFRTLHPPNIASTPHNYNDPQTMASRPQRQG